MNTTKTARTLAAASLALTSGFATPAPVGVATTVAQDGQYQYADLDGTAYFDTGYMVKDNSVFRFKMASRTSTVSYQSLFADYVDENTQATRVIVNQTSATDFYFNFRTKAGSASGASKVVSARGNPVEGVLSRSGAVLNGKSFTLNNVTAPASTATMKIGGKGSNANSATRFWYFIIEEDGVVLHHYVPWRDGAKVGIMDLKTGIFLENASSGGTVTLAEFLDFDGLQVTGSPMGYGASVPAYGLISSLEPGTTYTFSAPAVWTNEAATAVATCQGFTLRLANGTTVASSATQTNMTYSSELKGAVLTWLWAPHKTITVSNFDEDLATVYINGRPVADGETYSLAPGESTATLELRDFRSDWYFAYAPPSQTDRTLALKRWEGLPADADATANPVTFAVDADLTVTPDIDCKGHVWHAIGTTAISNSVYKMAASGFNAAKRTLTASTYLAYYAGDKVMDFAMRVRKDGFNYTVTSLGTRGMFKSSDVTTVRVAPRLDTLCQCVTDGGTTAFKTFAGLKESSIKAIPSYAFCYVPLTGVMDDYVPHGATSIGDISYSGRSGLAGPLILPYVKSIGGTAFSGCSGITELYSTSSVLTTIGAALLPGRQT